MFTLDYWLVIEIENDAFLEILVISYLLEEGPFNRNQGAIGKSMI